LKPLFVSKSGNEVPALFQKAFVSIQIGLKKVYTEHKGPALAVQ
jgi:hypothetical protein